MTNHEPAVNGHWPRLARHVQERRILVVGDVMLDHTAIGHARRLSPEAPVPVLIVDEERFGLGGAANVACNLASFGANVQLAGALGADEHGERLRALCDDLSIETDAVVSTARRKTTCKTRFVAGTQQVLRVDSETATPLAAEEEQRLIERLDSRQVDAVIISDYAKGIVTSAVIAASVDLARRFGVPCVVDPKGRHFERYAGCSVITPNADEASAASGIDADDDAASEAAGRVLLRAAGCEAVVVTRGRQGVSLVTSGEAWHLPAHTHDVFDVAGAGDTFVAVFALALASGASLLAAVRLANVAAGIAVQTSGVAVVTPDRLDLALERFDDREPIVALQRRLAG